ncbi:sulfite exporter TauE/SafE family protein [Aeromicrobium sp. A1-2]|uniref:sulfite exporter TauE/SafE family protein n=1 Tax=Aeromicrobium sp. A1-2 TaxID=2107713 RepID=UPI000E4AEAF2|nr:sulfite exporter TauE/SafE family protein [Aeromicrobium sp. A1-2]AXT84610.1 sulfite exporter TauE/SafE family protein [Aeromicrobium sp. A1-2]
MTAVLLALFLGALIGLSVGALGGGGSILAVPVLVYLLGESPAQATTGSLVVVAVTSVIAALTAARAGNVLLARGAVFGVVAIGGTAVGARAAVHVDEDVLMVSFAALLLLVGATMAWRQRPGRIAPKAPRRRAVDESATGAMSAARLRQAAGVLLTATVVGLLTGFLGVGGGFLVVPALLLVLALPMRYAVGTALVAIAITSTAALALRVGAGIQPDWTIVLALTATSAIGGFVGARLATRIDAKRLTLGFTVLVLSVAVYTAARAIPALF